MELALSAAEMGTCDWEVASGQICWDARTYEIFGVDPQTFVPCNESLVGLVNAEDATEARRLFDEAVRGGGRYKSVFRIRRPDGAERWIANDVVILRDDSGAPDDCGAEGWAVNVSPAAPMGR